MDNKYWEITSDGEIRPSKNFCADTFKDGLIIPDEVNGIKVTKIGNGAFSNWETLTGSLTLPNGLTEIGDSAFEDCDGFIGPLTMSENIISIGESAFGFCDGLFGPLLLSKSVTSIGKSAFEECSGFTGSLVLPDKLTTINRYTFYGCSGFTDVVIPSSITSIERGAFATLQYIDEAAFANCPNILTCYWRWEEYTSIQNFLESFFAITKEEDYAI